MFRVVKKKNMSKKIIFILILIFSIMFLLSIYKIIEWKIINSKDEKIMKDLENSISIDIESETETIYNINFKNLEDKNTDTVGFIKVNGTDIEYPVVQTSNNSYYLQYNFYKEYSTSGWIFADYRNKLDGTDKNIVVYGHNVKDGSMFNSLKNVLKKEWYENKENYIITFVTPNEVQKYEVFSIYEIEEEGYYTQTDFVNNDFKQYIETMKSRSIKDFNVEVKEEDRILTLSTCGSDNTKRIVLHSKR